jgi:hypothetical protein
MSTQLIAKLIEITYSSLKPDLSGYEAEDRLREHLIEKELKFTTEDGEGRVSFQNIGQGTESPSTVVTLQVKGVEFNQDSRRLTLDMRYVFYQQHGYEMLFSGTTTKFLRTSPFVQKLGPENILIEFVMHGDTVYWVNRCLPIFADVIRHHKSELHQTAVDWYDNREDEWGESVEVSLDTPVNEEVSIDDPIEMISKTADDKSYIEKYIKYLGEPYGDTRRVIDNRNTHASS